VNDCRYGGQDSIAESSVQRRLRTQKVRREGSEERSVARSGPEDASGTLGAHNSNDVKEGENALSDGKGDGDEEATDKAVKEGH